MRRYLPGRSPAELFRKRIEKKLRGPVPPSPRTPAQQFLRDLPVLHQRKGVAAHTGGLNPTIGQVIIDQVEQFDRPAVVETGSGASTVLFLMLGCGQVTSINPDPDIASRIEEDARARGLDTTPLRCIQGRSEIELPRLRDEGQRFDLGLIDGNHGWPAVFVDFCYINAMLNEGGILFIDDIQLYSCDELVHLLDAQPEYERVSLVGKLATFRKRTPGAFLPDWVDQPHIVEHTHPRFRSKRGGPGGPG